LTPGGPTLRALAETFGPDILHSDGTLDRARLAQRAFANADTLAQLNRIMHPPILRLLRAQIEGARRDLPPDTVIAVEVPLLFETGIEDWFDRVLVVSASEPTQLARLRARNGLEEAEARRRIAAQWPLAEKERRADWVIHNDGTREELFRAVDTFWDARISRQS
jgi:dephospho-CoA kinase